MVLEYIVAWNVERSRWEVLEHNTSPVKLYVLDRYLRKRPAKKQARRLAKKANGVYISYTKESRSRRRVAEKTDYSF